MDAEGTVYFCEKNGGLYAVRKDGSLKWNYTEIENYIFTGFALGADSRAYLLQREKPCNFISFDNSGNATIIAEYGDAQSMCPVSIGPDNRAYFGIKGGNIHAVDIRTSIASEGWPMRGCNMQGTNSLK